MISIGIFLLIMTVFIMIILIPQNGENIKNKIRQKQYTVSPANNKKVDLLEEQFALEQERNARTNARIDELEKKIVESYRQNNERIAQNLYNFHQELTRLNQVISDLERKNARKKEVRIIKPKEPPRAHRESNSTADKGLKSAGYQVRAIVGERAWIANEHTEQSVTNGDEVSEPRKSLRVKGVNADSNTVFTSSMP